MLKKLSQSFFGAVLLAAVFISFGNTALAQDAPKDQFWVVHEEIARVDMLQQYEKSAKEWNALMHEGGLDLTFFAFLRNDMHYYYVGKITNYADLDSINWKFHNAIEKIDKKKFASMMEADNASIKTIKEYVIRRSADLSYDPKTPRLKEGEAHFAHWNFIHYKLQDRDKVMGVLKEWKALYEKNNYPDGYGVFLIEFGGDLNELVVYDVAKSAEEYYKNEAAKPKEMKKKEQELFGKIIPYLVKVKEYTGWLRPDLSYIPEKK